MTVILNTSGNRFNGKAGGAGFARTPRAVEAKMSTCEAAGGVTREMQGRWKVWKTERFSKPLRECIGIPAGRYFPRPIMAGGEKVPMTVSRDFETIAKEKNKTRLFID